MIKRIIFDFDNTLVKWEKEYDNSIVRTYQKFGIELEQDNLDKFNHILRKYEQENEIFDIKLMTKFFNNNKMSMPEEFIDTWLVELEDCIPKNSDDLKEVLSYLSHKYTLVILTNWFTKSQVGRLRKIGILEYFTKIIGADQVKMKPSKEAFIYAKEEDNFDECIMIGDDVKIDLEIPKILGMKTILVTNETIMYDDKINDIKKLKEML